MEKQSENVVLTIKNIEVAFRLFALFCCVIMVLWLIKTKVTICCFLTPEWWKNCCATS